MIHIILLAKYPSWDPIYESGRLIVWTVVEAGLSIIASCLFVLRQLSRDPSSTSDRTSSTPWYSRSKSSPSHHLSGTRSRHRKRQEGWLSTRSHDDSQEEIVSVDVTAGKPAQSKDEEMNGASIELTPRENDRGPGLNPKHG